MHFYINKVHEEDEEEPTSFIISVISTPEENEEIGTHESNQANGMYTKTREKGENSFDSRSCVFRVLPYHMIIWYGGRRMDKHTLIYSYWPKMFVFGTEDKGSGVKRKRQWQIVRLFQRGGRECSQTVHSSCRRRRTDFGFLLGS